MDHPLSPARGHHEIRYEPMSAHGRRLSFPCDAHGRVHLDSLSERERNEYLFARALVGRDFAVPAVRACA